MPPTSLIRCLDVWMIGCIDVHWISLIYAELPVFFDDLNGSMWIEVSGSLLLEPLGGAWELTVEAFGIAWARCGHLLGHFGGPWPHLAPM